MNDENDPEWSFSSEGAPCKRGRPLTCGFCRLSFHRIGEKQGQAPISFPRGEGRWHGAAVTEGLPVEVYKSKVTASLLLGGKQVCAGSYQGGTLSCRVPPLVRTIHRIIRTIQPLSERPSENYALSSCQFPTLKNISPIFLMFRAKEPFRLLRQATSLLKKAGAKTFYKKPPPQPCGGGLFVWEQFNSFCPNTGCGGAFSFCCAAPYTQCKQRPQAPRRSE